VTASALVHLGIDQMQHVEQPPMLIMTDNIKEDMLKMLIAGTVGPVANLQKPTSTNSNYSGPDVIQNQYQDAFP